MRGHPTAFELLIPHRNGRKKRLRAQEKRERHTPNDKTDIRKGKSIAR